MSEPGPQAAVVLVVPSGTEFLAAVRDVARRAAELFGCDPALAEQVALAVDEAATNVIEHAYGGASDRLIELRFDRAGERLSVEIEDDGVPLDERAFPEVDLQVYASERRRGGLGVHLMGRIMDEVSFGRGGRGNVCRMLKRIGTVESREAS